MSMQEEELRRRRGAPAGGATGYEGIGGPGVMANQFASFAAGSPQYSFSGLQGQGGLAALLESMKQNPGRGVGPAGRNLAKQGFDIQFPGMDTQMGIGAPGGPIGGMDVAPGSPQGLAIGQSGQLPPGLARQVADIPRTQGWRNLAPGYSAAAGAGFGAEEQGQFPGMGGGGRVPPGVGAEVPGPGGGGGRPFQGGPAGPPGSGPNLQMGANKGGGGPAQGTGGPPGGNVAPPGGGGTKQTPKGVTPQVKKQAANQPTARGGAQGGVQTTAGVDRNANGSPKINPKTGGVTSQGQGILQGPTANGPSTQVAVPNAGNNNTPSETRPPTATKPAPSTKKGVSGSARGEAHQQMVTAGKKKSTGGGKPSKGGLAARRA